MPKDYKDAPAARAESRLNHPMLLGMIIGLLLGIVISLAVALWLNRLSNPFVEKGKTVEATPKMSAVQPPAPADAARAAEQRGKAAPDKGADKAAAKPDRPRFEFYQILPGEKEAVADKAAAPKDEARKAPAAGAAAAPAAEKPAAVAAAKPGASPASPKPHSGESYWLQAGAFSEEREADNLRARIALTGLEAAVRPVAIPERGTLYRVRLGPYQSLDDANRIKATLSQNGVGAAIIRTTDETKNP
jgi:cell division protein FtsN